MNIAELGFKVTTAPLKEAEKALDKLGDTAEAVDKSVVKVTDALDGLGKEAGTVAPQLDKLGRESVDATSAIDRLGTEASDASRAVDRLGTEAGDATRNVDRLGGEAAGAGGALSGMERAGAGVTAMLGQLAAAAAAAFGISQIVAAADAYTRMSGQLALATSSAAELATTQQMLFDIAQATRAPLEAVTGLYTKLSGALKEAGATSGQMASITATISQAMAISGTSAAAADGAIIQLAQAFASGALRGDEFNSVNEAAPRLMQALAASLGVGRGELRALAEQGKLTSDVLAQALTGEQARKMAEEFAKLPPTLSQAAQIAQNAFTRMVGEADKATGASAALAAGIIRVAEMIPRAFAGIADYFDGFASNFDVAASGFDLLGAEARRVVGDIGETFLTLPQTLGTIFVVIVAEAELAWTRIAALSKILDATLMQTWLGIKAGAIGVFAELALGVAQEFDRVVFALRDSAGVIATAFSAIPGASTAIRKAAEELDGYEGAYKQLSATVANGLISLNRQRQGWEDLAEQTRTTANVQIDAVTAARDATLADLDATRQMIRTRQENSFVIADSITLTTKATAATISEAEAKKQAASAAKEFGAANALAAKGVETLQQMIDRLNYESMTPHEKAAADYALRMREIAESYAAIVAVGPPTAAEIARVGEAQALAAQRLVDDVARIDKQIADKGQQSSRQWAEYWRGATDAVASAFGDFVASGMKSFSDFGQSLKRIAQQIISDLVAQFARSRIVIPIMAALGVPGMASAGGIGGAVNAVAGAAGGGAGGTGLFGGLLGGIGTAIGGFTAGLGVAGSAGLAAAGQFGLASLAAGNFAVGLGALAGALGPIGLALGGINALTGGRLFGTSYKTNATGSQLNFGQDGATGFNFQEQSRRRSLFRGTARRTVESALGEDAQAQIDQFFAQVGVAVAQAAGQLGVDIPPRITASFRATTDASGNVISEVGTILGRQYNESFEVFSRRIAAENVIGVLDAALDGEAGRIAEAWRGSADQLADGAQFLLNAATDMRGGFRLLGDASLTGVAELVQRLAGDGESLTAAYARISGATRLLEEAVSLSGVTLDMTREQFVTFAAGIAEAAGGLERAQSLWASYFSTFYTEQERGLVQLQQARTRASTLATPIGLNLSDFTGEGGAAAFRQLFESRLPTLTAAQVVQWLEFGQALGTVIDLQGRYTDAVIQTAESITDFMSGVNSALSEFSPELSLQAQLDAQRTANDQMIERARELGASEADLARVRELGERRINAIIAQVQGRTDSFVRSLGMLGTAFRGTNEAASLAAQGVSESFASVTEQFLEAFDPEGLGMYRLAQAQVDVQQALARTGMAASDLATDEMILAAARKAASEGNYELAESIMQYGLSLRREAALIRNTATGGTGAGAAPINNGNGNPFGLGVGGGQLGFGAGLGGGGEDPAGGLVSDIDRIRQGLRDWLQSLTTGDLAPGRPRELLARAQADYQRLLALAQGGDAQALQQLQGASELVLRLGRQVFGSTAGYNALYDQIIREVGGLVGFTPGATAGGGPNDGVGRLGASAMTAAAALDRLSEALGLQPGSLSGVSAPIPSTVFGGQSDGVVGELRAQREADAAAARETQEILRNVRAELAELKAAQRDGVAATQKQTEVMRDRR